MRRHIDEQKRDGWEQRLARYRASGLTIAGFCRRESVAVHTFYYWAKRLAALGPAKSLRRPVEKPEMDCAGGALRREPSSGKQSVLGHRRARPANATALGGSHVEMVHFNFQHGACLSIPANCLEAIRCVVQCVEQSVASQGTAFREVLLSR
jgi:hypothetical protein